MTDRTEYAHDNAAAEADDAYVVQALGGLLGPMADLCCHARLRDVIQGGVDRMLAEAEDVLNTKGYRADMVCYRDALSTTVTARQFIAELRDTARQMRGRL